MSEGDKGRAIKFLMNAQGWGEVSDPAGFERVFAEDIKLLIELIEEVRDDEKRRIGKALGKEANRIYSHQKMDYPSNILDRIHLHLSCNEPLEVRGEMLSRCKRQQIKCSGCLDCLPKDTTAL